MEPLCTISAFFPVNLKVYYIVYVKKKNQHKFAIFPTKYSVHWGEIHDFKTHFFFPSPRRQW